MGFGFVLNLGQPKNQRKGITSENWAISQTLAIYAPQSQPTESHTPPQHEAVFQISFRALRGQSWFDSRGSGWSWRSASSPVYIVLWHFTGSLPLCVKECFDVSNDPVLNDALSVCPHVSKKRTQFIHNTGGGRGLPVWKSVLLKDGEKGQVDSCMHHLPRSFLSFFACLKTKKWSFAHPVATWWALFSILMPL